MPFDFKNLKKPKSPDMAARAKKTKDAIVRGFGGKPTGRKPNKSTTRAY